MHLSSIYLLILYLKNYLKLPALLFTSEIFKHSYFHNRDYKQKLKGFCWKSWKSFKAFINYKLFFIRLFTIAFSKNPKIYQIIIAVSSVKKKSLEVDGFLRIFAKITEKHLCQRLFFNKTGGVNFIGGCIACNFINSC